MTQTPLTAEAAPPRRPRPSGIALAAFSGPVSLPPLALEFSAALWKAPTFSVQAVMGLSVPLLVVTMVGQGGQDGHDGPG
jgi:hypothetical protein